MAALRRRNTFFWYYVVPSAVAGGMWGAASLPLLTLGIVIVAFAAGQIWIVRKHIIDPNQIAWITWLAVPTISLSILLIGGAFAAIGYALARTVLGIPLVSN